MNRDHQLCGPDCKYRALYEGAQHSLTGLSANHTEALARLGRLRLAVARDLKRFFPSEFAEAERTLLKRLDSDDVSEDLLAAYLESFLQMVTAKAPASGSDIARLRASLAEMGVNVKGSFTVSDLATATERHVPPAPQRDISSIFASGWSEPAPEDLKPVPEIVDTIVTPIPRPQASSEEYPFEDNYDSGYEESSPLDSVFNTVPNDTSTDIPVISVPIEPPTPEQVASTLDELFSVVTPIAKPPKKSHVKPATEPGPWANDATLSPLKPQSPAAPAKTRPRATKRTPRVSAQSPTEPAADLDDAVRNQLLAAVCIPRPVFTADLVELVHSHEVVAAMEEEWSNDPELPIRFVGAKTRHRNRGSLIVPQEFLLNSTPEMQNSLWARVSTQYKGAKAYELGVLLHRYNEAVVSDTLGPHVAIFRLNQPQGLIGVLCVIDASLGAGAPTRLALVEALEILMRERLVQIAILTTNAELTDTIGEVVTEEAALRKWAPTAPVTLSRSWDYAAGTGTALPLLGV